MLSKSAADGIDNGRAKSILIKKKSIAHNRLAEPMLATPGTMPADPEQFAYEVKWDGYRMLAHYDGKRLMLTSRNGLNLSPSLPEIAGLGGVLDGPVILDGEVVALDKDGRPSFSALQKKMTPQNIQLSSESPYSARQSVHYMIFDILSRNNKSVMNLSYIKRRELLESLAIEGDAWHTPPRHSDGQSLLNLMRKNNQEGIIAKRLNSIYLPGRRSADWIKIKIVKNEEFVIVGWWTSGKNELSSLLLGYYPRASSKSHLLYCGKVGTGFNDMVRQRLEAALQKLKVKDPVVAGSLPSGPGISWCKPTLVAQIRFSEWTHDGCLRHPTFLGLRIDKQPHEVIHHVQGAK